VEAVELGAGEAASRAAGADAGMEEAFVGVDVADAGEERLIEQCGFDGKLAAAEEGGKFFGGDGEGFETGGGEGFFTGEVAEFEAAEAARVYEAELFAALETEAGVGVRGDFGVRRGNEQAAGHAEVDDPLGTDGVSSYFCFRRVLLAGILQRVCQFADDVFAGAVNGVKDFAFEALGLLDGAGFEGLFVAAKPGFYDFVALDSLMDAVGDGFYFGELGHEFILEDSF